MKSREEFTALLKQKQQKRVADEKARQEYEAKRVEQANAQLDEFCAAASHLIDGQKLDGDYKVLVADVGVVWKIDRSNTIRFSAVDKKGSVIALIDVTSSGLDLQITDSHINKVVFHQSIDKAIEEVADLLTNMSAASIAARKPTAMKLFN